MNQKYKFKLTDFLLMNQWFIDDNFISILKSFNKVYVEIDFKYCHFETMIGKIFHLRDVYKCKIAASVIFENTDNIDQILIPKNVIEIARLNDSKQKI